jgi:hypothetical protein
MGLMVKQNRGQIILRINDAHGHHIIRRHETGWKYTIEGYREQPKDYLLPPCYYSPYTEEEIAKEFREQGKEWRD